MTYNVFHEIACLLLCAAAVGLLDATLRQPVMVSFIRLTLILFPVGLTLKSRLARMVRPFALATGLGRIASTPGLRR